MIPAIDVRHDLGRISFQLGLLQKERMAAAVRALNRTLTTVRAEGARAMAKEYPGLKVGTLKRQMRFKRASRAEPRATLTFSNKRFRLFGNWRATQTPHGVRVRVPFRIETGDGRRLNPDALKHAFLQRARNSGVPNVWLRVGRERYPIAVLVAPSLAAAFVEKKIGEALARRAPARFAAVFLQEAKFRLAKRI